MGGARSPALLLGTVGVFLALALASYAGAPVGPDGVAAAAAPHGADWVGPVGESCARTLVTLLGWVAYAVPVEVLLLAIPFVTGESERGDPGSARG